jgi:hypothetical protein
LVGVATAILVAEQWSTWKDPELPNREAAAYAVSIQRTGGTVCGARYSGEPLWAYARRPVAALGAGDFAPCRLVVGIPSHPLERNLLAAAHRLFPHTWTLRGRNADMVLFSRTSRSDLEPLPGVGISAGTNQ